MTRLVAASPRRADLEATLADGGIVALVDGPAEACAVANAVAPEHLELLVDDAEALLGSIESAGAVFLGTLSPASFGDYLAGPEPRAADQPDGTLRAAHSGSTTSAVTSTRSRSTRRRSRPSVPTW